MDSQYNVVAPRRKLKFAPKAPPLRNPKPEVKTKMIDNDDSVQAKDLSRHFNENSMKARPKVEKKVSASQITFGDGGGININGSHSSTSNVVREKKYKEPWDYYSYYPTSLPVRRPYVGNPKTLKEEEFGEVAESRTYDENSSNPTMELGQLEENSEKSMFLIQLPATLPIIKGSAENVLIDGIRLGVLPDVVTYNTLINAYSRFLALMLVMLFFIK
ncbi:putative DNA-directed RNA polymerase III subunit RPC4 [Lupinus albus]|uniref:Putative DNA-directed RNA polymerase III subunit RPC4 n=1 Tax=Lupinus albus TaxID=3870 RepID=A0A6A4P7R1_LUPAL|nr:putative DNA-directed RNA polymerase III subunit RPC4 [Lupinus albus]